MKGMAVERPPFSLIMHQSFDPEEFSMEEMYYITCLSAFKPPIPGEHTLLQKFMIIGKKLQSQADSRVSAYVLANLPSEN